MKYIKYIYLFEILSEEKQIGNIEKKLDRLAQLVTDPLSIDLVFQRCKNKQILLSVKKDPIQASTIKNLQKLEYQKQLCTIEEEITI